MKKIFTIAYSEEEANEIGHFIMRKGYEGVQNDSYRYCREAIGYAFSRNKKHHRDYVFVGCTGGQMIVARSKRVLRRKGIKYIEKKRVFCGLLTDLWAELNAKIKMYNEANILVSNTLTIQQ